MYGKATGALINKTAEINCLLFLSCEIFIFLIHPPNHQQPYFNEACKGNGLLLIKKNGDVEINILH